MPAPADHGAAAGGEGGGWIRGTYPKDRSMYARRSDGTERKLMSWMPRLDKFRLTKWGKDYYSHNRQEFIINVPCIGYKWDQHRQDFVMCTEGHIRGGEPRRSEYPYTRQAPDLDQDPAEVRRALLERMREELMSMEVLDTEKGSKFLVYKESDLMWCWDEDRELTFDEQVVRHIYANDTIDFETVMDRPLRGAPLVDEKMYRRMGLCPLATTEITSPGGCVVAQIVATVTKESRITVGSNSGTRTRTENGRIDNRKRQRQTVQVPRFEPAQVIEKFNKIFAKLYPGEAVSEEDYEEGLVEPTRAYPYQFADWLEVGVTSRMVVEFCEWERIALRVVYKNRIIFTSGEMENKSIPVMVFAIHSDHAFFYDKWDAKNGASQLHPGPIKVAINAEPETMRLRLPFDEDDATPFAEMVEYPGFWGCYEQMVGVQDPDPVVYWCYPNDIKEIKADMLEANIPFWESLGNRPETTRSLNFEFGKGNSRYGHPVKIRVVPENVFDFVDFCETFHEQTTSPSSPHGFMLTYNGEGMSALMCRSLERLAVSRRREWLQSEREAILTRQGHLCPGCGDRLCSKYHIDHEKPLSRGGTNELDNLQALCPLCHAGKTQDEELDTGRMHTIQSQMAPTLWRELHKCPKPTEVSWGRMSHDQLAKKMKPRRPDEETRKKLKLRLEWAKKSIKATRTRHVLDLLMKRASPRAAKQIAAPNGISELICMDAKSCRVFALTKRDRGLPLFLPLDEPMPFVADHLPRLDFVFVDAGEKHRFPYTGARWYAAEVVQHMLQIGAVKLEHCVASLEASRHMEPQALEQHFEFIKMCWEETIYKREGPAGKTRAEAVAKQAILSMIGLWNATEQHAWSKTRSTYQTDAGENVKLRRDIGDGSYEFTSSVELVSLYVMSPLGRIALDVEQMRISQALIELERHHTVTVVGAHVDGVFALATGWDDDLRHKLESAYRFRDGSPVFHIKTKEPISKVPSYKQNEEPRCQTWTFQKHQWNVVRETDLVDLANDIADLFEQHGGLFLSGPAGVGKTVLLHNLLNLLCKSTRPIVAALRHCAAMLVGGKTLQHYLSKYNSKGGSPKRGQIVCVDEISEVQGHTLQQLAQWKLMGVRFIFAGDLDGQFKPIFDQMADVMNAKDLRLSRFLFEMCGGLHVKLTTYRRGTDVELFRWYTGLYKWADNRDFDKVQQLVNLTRKRYPLRNEEIDIHLVMSHKLRVQINAEQNAIQAARQERTLFLKSPGEMPGIMMQPQDMHIWEGLELLCHRRKHVDDAPVNGGLYRVYSWDHQTVTIRLTEEYRQRYEWKPANREANDDEESEDEDLREAREAAEEYRQALIDLKTWHTLGHEEAAKILRLQHALVYANIQGRTMREKHICLMDTANRNFTVRHLIVAVSRATHGRYVHVPTAAQEVKIRQGTGRTVAIRPEQPAPRTAAAPRRPGARFATAEEWLAYSRNRGVLVEELYKRPNWRGCLGLTATQEKNSLRKKLLEMSPEELARALVKLDRA